MSPHAARERLRRVWFFIGWVGIAVVAYYSLIPRPPELDIEQGDKIQHFLAYGSLMLWFGQIMTTPPSRRLSGVLLVLLGVGLECLQGFTGYRTFSYADMAANTTGVLIGWALSPPRGPQLYERILTRIAPGRVL